MVKKKFIVILFLNLYIFEIFKNKNIEKVKRKKRKKISIINIRNEMGHISRDPVDIRKIIRGCYE